MATKQPKPEEGEQDRTTYFETMWDSGESLLRENSTTGQFWGMTDDKAPRKARKGEVAFYSFLHTAFSSKRRFPIAMLFEEPVYDESGVKLKGDGTSFTELLKDQLDIPGLMSAFAQAGRYKNVQEDGNWVQVEQPEDKWEATIDVLLTVTEKDQKFTQTCFPDNFLRTGYTQGVGKMEEQNKKRPFIINDSTKPRIVHYTILPQEFDALPF